MPAIFISHSSLDQPIANDVKTALDQFGFENVFLDFDKVTGFGAEENWEKRLYEELSRCHAVILVLTPNWLTAKWCFVEMCQARALGKLILPIVCEPLGQRVVLPGIQSVDLLDWKADGLDKLERRLRVATPRQRTVGHAPRSAWPPGAARPKRALPGVASIVAHAPTPAAGNQPEYRRKTGTDSYWLGHL